MQAHVQVKALKVTVVVPADHLPPLPEGEQAVLFLATPDKLLVKARLNPKSYCRALAAIAQHGAENVAVLVQGQMSKADAIESAGISAVLKKPKEAEPGAEG